MRKFFVSVSVKTIAATSIISISAILGTPALAQQEVVDEATSEIVETLVDSEEVEDAEPIEAITAEDPDIPTDELELLLKPLMLDNMTAEADAWFLLLQEKTQEITDAEIEIIRQGGTSGASDAGKEQKVVEATELEVEQSTLIARLSTVLDALDEKGGDTVSYRQYMEAISGIQFNITDTEGLSLRFTTWLQSEEGGIRWGLNLLKFGGILLATVVIAPRAGKLANAALSRVPTISTLFRDFAVMVVKRSVLAAGGLLALAAIGVNLGPIVAVLGGASFVVAFALQSNLGNFASGLMLLVSKPFDVGDEVEVAGYWAFIDSISLANTKLKAFNGSIITLPNNSVWGGDIINYTHAKIRAISITINVKFSADLDKIKTIWMEIAAAHPDVLADPGPSLFPWNKSYDYCLSVGLKAWTPTDKYWPAYVDLLKSLQIQLPEAGIEFASPQQDRNIYQLSAQRDNDPTAELISASAG